MSSPMLWVLGTLVLASPALFASSPDDLSGHWKSSCQYRDHQNLVSNATFAGDQLEIVNQRFADTRCRTLQGDLALRGHFEVSAAASSGVASLDFHIDGALLTPRSSTAALGMNFVGACGFENWEAGVGREVAGLDCDGEPVPAKGSTLYQIIGLDGASLYFGALTAEADGKTIERRPSTLDTAAPFKRARRD